MFLSLDQIRESLGRLKEVHPFFGISFLVFKKGGIPIGLTRRLVFDTVASQFMHEYFRPTAEFDGYYQPFYTSKSQERWVSARYPSTSLQRITKDTYGDCLIHPSGSSEWGWQEDYVERLKHKLAGRPLPAFDLAVWLFRGDDFSADIEPKDVVAKLLTEFDINAQERTLFDLTVTTVAPLFVTKAATEYDLLSIIGFPPAFVPSEGVTLRTLRLQDTGPAQDFVYEPSERLNIITGDNGLGKTFILECVWWSLTRRWSDASQPILPRPGTKVARISYELSVGEDTLPAVTSRFNWKEYQWVVDGALDFITGIVIYARYDGSFAVYDPARVDPDPMQRDSLPLLLKRDEVWQGRYVESRNGRKRALCNGMIEDWVLWQRGGAPYERQFSAFKQSLQILSGDVSDRLLIGEPTRLPGDSREIPTIAMPYGDIPIVHASAGMQRILSLAYVLVWAWNEHRANSEAIGQPPQKRVVLLIDEVEAHLHPRWQRKLVPGIMSVVKALWGDVATQVHLGTHSPLVLASAESEFDESIDDLHHLRLEQEKVVLRELKFIKRGTVDAWLMSDAFELQSPRSLEGEKAIELAKQIQLADAVDAAEVRDVHRRLAQALAEDDRFWPRWRFFALQHGVDE